jgi:adenylate kinase
MDNPRMQIVLLGPPGAGKGTQATRVAGRFRLAHVAIGDIFRDQVARGTELGRVAQGFMDSGELVPDEVVSEIVMDRLGKRDCRAGFLLDGYPRNLAQARTLDHWLGQRRAPLEAVLHLVVPRQELLRRLAERSRADDNEQTIHNRLRVFTTTVRPLIDYYAGQDVLIDVDAGGAVDEVTRRITACLEETVLARRGRPPGAEAVVPMRIVLLGAPGAGKGTQGSRIAARLGVPHVAVGNTFRANVAQGTPLGRVAQEYLDSGELVPDEVVNEIVMDRLGGPDCRTGFVLDGYPRSVTQAEVLDEMLGQLNTPLEAALDLEVSKDELFHRLAGSRRPDDSPRILHRRLEIFTRTTRPLADYYAERGLLVAVDGRGSIGEVAERVQASLQRFAARSENRHPRGA